MLDCTGVPNKVQFESPVIHSCLPQSVSGDLRCLPPAGDDGLWVNLLGNEKLRLL